MKGKAAAEHALQLDPSLAEAHTALALLTFHDWNFADAEREYRLAVALAPNYATAHHWYGDGFLVLMGRFDETNRETVSMDDEYVESDKFGVSNGATMTRTRRSAKCWRWIPDSRKLIASGG